VKARKPSDLSPCTPYASDSGGSFVTPELGRTASLRGSFVTPLREYFSLLDFVVEATRMMGGGPHRCWLRPVPFTSEAPGGRPCAGGGGSEELPHELGCDCEACLNA